MKLHSVDYVRDSYPEGLQFTQDEVTVVSLKHRFWYLKLQWATEAQIQQSLALHHKVLKEEMSNFERNLIPQPARDAQIITPFGCTLQSSPNIHDHATLQSDIQAIRSFKNKFFRTTRRT